MLSLIRKSFLLALICAIHQNIYSQSTITLQKQDSGNKEYIATDEIVYKNGYKYTAQTSVFMDGKISGTSSSSTGQDIGIGDISSKSINYSLPVGLSTGTASVTPQGAASYSVPIIIPQGLANMTPSLSLEYNSQGGNGPYGYGWNLNVSSSITHTRKTWYNDGDEKIAPDSDLDPYMLDGSRLIGPETPQVGSIYKTTLNQFMQIKVKSMDGAEVSEWEVKTKDDRTLTYSAVLIDDYNVTVPVRWSLTKSIDNYGNYISYSYDDGANWENYHLIDEINYGGNEVTNTPHSNKVKFNYTTRAHGNLFCYRGAAIEDQALLSSIDITRNSSSFKTYEFNYTSNTYQLRGFGHNLIKITEKGSNGTSLNPIEFEYSQHNFTTHDEKKVKWLDNSNNKIVETGDFNGDGFADLLVLHYTRYGYAIKTDRVYYKKDATLHDDYQLYLNDKNGGFELVTSGTLPQPGNTYSFEPANQINYGDFNGDGKLDILVSNMSVNFGSNQVSKPGYMKNMKMLLSTGSAFTVVSVPLNNNYSELDYGTTPLVGDFDGDGRHDIITNLTEYNHAYYETKLIRYIDGQLISNWIGNSETTHISQGNPIINSSYLNLTDFDGDGSTDLVTVENDVAKAFNITKNLNFSPNYQFNELASKACINQFNMLIAVGDFNGDGRGDLLFGKENTQHTTFRAFLSKDNSFESHHYSLDDNSIYFRVENGNHELRTGDFNGDGITDFFTMFPIFAPNSQTEIIRTTIKTYYSTGTKVWFEETENIVKGKFDKYFNSFEGDMIALGDLNGDGITDIVSLDESTGDLNITYYNKYGKSNLLKRVANGFNQVTSFEYGSLLQDEELYSVTETQSFPYNMAHIPLHAVKSMTMPDGVGGTKTINYSYKNGIIHRELGFLGFKAFTSHETTSDLESTQTAELHATLPLLLPSGTIAKVEGQLTASTSYSYTTTDHNDGTYTVHKTQEVVTNHLLNRTSTTSSTFDAFGNPTQGVTNINNGYFISTENYTYDVASYGSHGSWIPSRPITTSRTVTRSGETPITRSIHYTYDAKGGVATSVAFQGTAKEVTATYQYDNFGNTTSIATSAQGLTTRTTAYEYDATGMYRVKKTNPLGQETISVYDPIWGAPTSITSIDGLTTTYAYDEFGRITTTTLPLSSGVINQSYTWNTSGDPNGNGTETYSASNAVFYVEKTATASPTSKQYYDAFGRERKLTKEGFNQPSTIVTTYNSQGQVVSVTDPFFEGQSGGPVFSKTYDQYGRIIQENNKGIIYNRSFSVDANGFLTTTDNNLNSGQTRSDKEDPTGVITEVNDAGGTLLYYFTSENQPRRVTLDGVETSLITYDAYGRQASLTDPNSGVNLYEYNAFGELIWQKDANNNMTTLSYDVLGRITTESYAESTNTYQYITSGNGINQLSSVTGTNAVSQQYTYNALGLPTETTTTIDGESFVSDFVYNVNGRLIEQSYPSGFTVKMEYDSKGFLTKIKDQTETITYFEALEKNAAGLLTKHLNGNGIECTNTYNSFHSLDRRYAPGVFDYTLTYDADTRNILSRQDNINGLNETFTYDILSRLTSTQVDNLPLYPMTYADNGNISTKWDAGTLSYDQQKVNAVVNATNPLDEISSISQSITNTSFHQPNTITEGNFVLTFKYGPNQQRIRSVLTDNGTTIQTKTYLGNYEKIVSNNGTTEVHYIGALGGVSIIHLEFPNEVNDTYYAYTDHLGSMLTLTDDQGAIAYKQNFDAWGRYRNPDDWTYNNISASPEWLRGYTGHEHLTAFGIIHMNGRLYDPILGRMLNTDNFVQSPYNSQSYNRYAYVFNNPLKYTDPDGEWIHIAIGALVGGVVNLVTNWDNIDSFGEGLASFGAGAASGALTAGLGPGGAALGGMITGATNSIVAQTGNGVGLGDVDWGQVGRQGTIGGFSGLAGYGAGQFAGKAMNGLLGNFGNSVFGGLLTGAGGGGLGGYTGGFVSGFLMTGNLANAHQAGMSGLWTGIGIGGAAGAAGNYISAKKDGINPWTGKSTNKSYENQALRPHEKGEQGVQEAIREIEADGGTILQKEITLEVNGVRVRLDIAADFNGEIFLYEVKNGPYARNTPNQNIAYPLMKENIPIIPRGENAANVFGPNQLGIPTTRYILVIKKYK